MLPLHHLEIQFQAKDSNLDRVMPGTKRSVLLRAGQRKAEIEKGGGK